MVVQSSLSCFYQPRTGSVIPSKSLNVNDFGMKMYTSQPTTALLGRKAELSLAERCTLELRASTNLLNFEMIGSWPTHAEKRGEKDIFVEQDPIISSRRRPITDLFPLYCTVLLSSKNQFSHFILK